MTPPEMNIQLLFLGQIFGEEKIRVILKTKQNIKLLKL